MGQSPGVFGIAGHSLRRCPCLRCRRKRRDQQQNGDHEEQDVFTEKNPGRVLQFLRPFKTKKWRLRLELERISAEKGKLVQIANNRDHNIDPGFAVCADKRLYVGTVQGSPKKFQR
jgi:hypothetical protein